VRRRVRSLLSVRNGVVPRVLPRVLYVALELLDYRPHIIRVTRPWLRHETQAPLYPLPRTPFRSW
jgi:hypothetical protein